MIKCPHCGRAAMTLLQKSRLGPGRSVPCQYCGKNVTPHWTIILAAIPAFLGGLKLVRSEEWVQGIAAVVAGLLLMAMIVTFVVPLVKAP